MAAETLDEHGWTAFQDPWFPEVNGGAALFRQYPHFPHQIAAVVSVVFDIDPWLVLRSMIFLGVLLLPLFFYGGGRLVGLPPPSAALVALVAATLRTLDPFGHDLFHYGLSGKGLFGQLWGMNFAILALAAWLAASLRHGAGLRRWKPWARIGLAAVLVSATIRSSLPAGWLLVLCSLGAVLFAGPLRTLPARLGRFLLVGALALLLSLGFLLPFQADLPASHTTILEMAPDQLHSVGMEEVLRRLAGGAYFDGGTLGPWTILFGLALLAPLVGFFRPRLWDARLRGLSFAGLVALLLREDNIREVIPFPKTATAACLMTGAPAGIEDVQLDELYSLAQLSMEGAYRSPSPKVWVGSMKVQNALPSGSGTPVFQYPPT